MHLEDSGPPQVESGPHPILSVAVLVRGTGQLSKTTGKTVGYLGLGAVCWLAQVLICSLTANDDCLKSMALEAFKLRRRVKLFGQLIKHAVRHGRNLLRPAPHPARLRAGDERAIARAHSGSCDEGGAGGVAHPTHTGRGF